MDHNPYTIAWPTAALDWAAWTRNERTTLHEDFTHDVFNARRGNETRPAEATKFERKVAYLFRTQLGMLDVQRGFNGNAGGNIDACGPHSRVIIECKAYTNGIAANQMHIPHSAWMLRNELRDWRKFFVTSGGVTGVIPQGLHDYFHIFQVIDNKLVAHPGNVNAEALLGQTGARWEHTLDAYRAWMTAAVERSYAREAEVAAAAAASRRAAEEIAAAAAKRAREEAAAAAASKAREEAAAAAAATKVREEAAASHPKVTGPASKAPIYEYCRSCNWPPGSPPEAERPKAAMSEKWPECLCDGTLDAKGQMKFHFFCGQHPTCAYCTRNLNERAKRLKKVAGAAASPAGAAGDTGDPEDSMCAQNRATRRAWPVAEAPIQP